MPATFRLQVVSLRAMVFDDEVRSAYLFGDEGEYELLPYHFPLMGVLPEGVIKIAYGKSGSHSLPVKSGIVLFNENRCTIVIEETEETKTLGTAWSALEVLRKTEVKK